MELAQTVADELKLTRAQVDAVLALLKDEASVPFIARYRKALTGGLAESSIRAIAERFEQLDEFEKRRALVIKTVSEAGKMTPELQTKIETISSRPELEDIYMSFRTRRRLRSAAAKQKGLEALAELIWKQEPAAADAGTPEEIVKPYINAEKGVKDMADALAGARDMLAERISEDAPSRKLVRDLLLSEGKLSAKAREGIDVTKGKFAALAGFAEPLNKVPLHRILLAIRAASEKQISMLIEPPREKIVQELKNRLMPNPEAAFKPELALAIEESFDRLLGPALDNEVRQELKRRADLEAIASFARNLRAMLMQAPLGAKPVLAIEPSLAAGLRLALLDGAGKVLSHTVIHPQKSEDEKKSALETLLKLVNENNVSAVAIGSGPGSREADMFVRDAFKGAEIKDVFRIVVHGPSQAPRDEAEVDPLARGAAAIGRRLQDPLAELVKYDVTSIGLGQYQHDVDQALLKQKLEHVLESCVNEAGVNAGTASLALLRYVSGIGPQNAAAVVEARKAHGEIKSREDLRKLTPSPKVFEQCAGFMRVSESENALDKTAIHPEQYEIAESMAAAAGVSLKELAGNAEALAKIDLSKLVTENRDEATLKDILAELKSLGQDVRGPFVKPEFNEDVSEIKDLKDGQLLNGIVTNLTPFGAFIDIGVHQDGLVHISAITHKFIRDASEILTVGQHVKVKVIGVDQDRKRISLSIKDLEEAPKREPRRGAASSGARPPRPARPPRERQPAKEGAAPGTAPAGAPQGAPGAQRGRSDDRSRGRRFPPRTAPAAGAGAPAAAAAGATPGAATPAGAPEAGRGRFVPREGGANRGRSGGTSSSGGGGRGGERNDRTPRAPAPPEPGKPDYSKFFVKGKRKERPKTDGARGQEGASRDEVRQVMKSQEGRGTSLADLLRKAGVVTDDSSN